MSNDKESMHIREIESSDDVSDGGIYRLSNTFNSQRSLKGICNQQFDFLADLPDELLLEIYLKTNPKYLMRARGTNTRHKKIATQALFMQHSKEAFEYQGFLLKTWLTNSIPVPIREDILEKLIQHKDSGMAHNIYCSAAIKSINSNEDDIVEVICKKIIARLRVGGIKSGVLSNLLPFFYLLKRDQLTVMLQDILPLLSSNVDQIHEGATFLIREFQNQISYEDAIYTINDAMISIAVSIEYQKNLNILSSLKNKLQNEHASSIIRVILFLLRQDMYKLEFDPKMFEILASFVVRMDHSQIKETTRMLLDYKCNSTKTSICFKELLKVMDKDQVDLIITDLLDSLNKPSKTGHCEKSNILERLYDFAEIADNEQIKKIISNILPKLNDRNFLPKSMILHIIKLYAQRLCGEELNSAIKISIALLSVNNRSSDWEHGIWILLKLVDKIDLKTANKIISLLINRLNEKNSFHKPGIELLTKLLLKLPYDLAMVYYQDALKKLHQENLYESFGTIFILTIFPKELSYEQREHIIEKATAKLSADYCYTSEIFYLLCPIVYYSDLKQTELIYKLLIRAISRHEDMVHYSAEVSMMLKCIVNPDNCHQFINAPDTWDSGKDPLFFLGCVTDIYNSSKEVLTIAEPTN